MHRILTAPHYRRLAGPELGLLNGSDLMLPRDIATACPKLRQLNPLGRLPRGPLPASLESLAV